MTKQDLINLINKCPDDVEFVIWGDDGRLYNEFRLSVVYTKNQDTKGCVLISNKYKISKKNDKT